LGNLVLTGINHAGDATTQAAKNDLVAAYNAAAGQAVTQTVATELGSTTKGPGVYNSAAGTFTITGTLTLDGQGDPNAVFIFQAASTLITAASSNVVLINGAQASNVFWQVGSSATLGTSSNLLGTVLALTSITATTSATVSGRLLARNGAVTLDTNSILIALPAGTTLATLESASAVSALNDLLAASSCFWRCWKEEEMLAVELLVRAYELAGIAGQPNYTGAAGLAQLVQDAKSWSYQVLDASKRQGIALYIDQENAFAVNPATPIGAGSVNALKAASACFSCIPFQQKKNYLLYLKWVLNGLGKPE
jgi:hypothetical protein